jgi:hypothetical protein
VTHDTGTIDINQAEIINPFPAPRGPAVDLAREAWLRFCRGAVPTTPDKTWPGMSAEAKAQSDRIAALKTAYDEARAEITRLSQAIDNARAQRPEVVREAVAQRIEIPEDERPKLRDRLEEAKAEARDRHSALQQEAQASFDVYREAAPAVAEAADAERVALIEQATVLVDDLDEVVAQLHPVLLAENWSRSGPSPHPKPSPAYGELVGRLEALHAALGNLS